MQREAAIINTQDQSLASHGKVTGAVVGLKFQDGHTHNHVTDPAIGGQLTHQFMRQFGITPGQTKILDTNAEENKKVRKFILHQAQSPGDILTMSNAVGDLKRTYPHFLIDVRSPCNEVWDHNPHLTHIEDDDPDAEKHTISYDDINISGWDGLHFADAFRNDMEKKLGVKITKTGYTPELYLHPDEKKWVNQVEVEYGWKGPFWVINAGRKPDNELKQYHRWQEVVDILNWYFKGKVKIVQIGYHNPEDPDNHIHPKLNGVLNLLGKTDVRQLIRLMWWSHGSIGPLSFQFVVSAALKQPFVCVAGSKEGVRWHIYPNGRYIYTNGSTKCAEWDGCWLGGNMGKCIDLINGIPKCFTIIKPYQIADAVKLYYEGGFLNMNERDYNKKV